MRYFLARYNRYYAFIMQQDIRLLYCAVILFQCIVVLVWVYVWYIPTRKEIGRLEQSEHSDVIQSYAVYKKRTDDLRRYISGLEKRYYADVCIRHKPDSIMHTICTITKDLAIEMQQCVVSHKKNGDEYALYSVQLDLAANIQQLKHFFDACVARTLPVRCVRCDGTYEKQPSTRLVLHWYCFVDKKSPSTLEKS